MSKLHYVAIARLYGYVHTHCEVHKTYDVAVASLVESFSLNSTDTGRLKRDGHLEPQQRKVSYRYYDITECYCSRPEQHTES